MKVNIELPNKMCYRTSKTGLKNYFNYKGGGKKIYRLKNKIPTLTTGLVTVAKRQKQPYVLQWL